MRPVRCTCNLLLEKVETMNKDAARVEAVQVAAMALRLIADVYLKGE